jgi:hypothetical protein
MSDVTKAKQMARAIVNVVKQNNKLYFYNTESSTIPKKIICLDGLKAVEVTKDFSYYYKAYDVIFTYYLDNSDNNIYIRFPCEGPGYIRNSATKSYHTITCNWEKETEEIIENIVKLV